MRRLLVLVAVSVLLAPAGAEARSAGFVPIRAGDQVRIAGSTVRCVVQEAAILCVPFAGGVPKVGAYGTVAIPGGQAVAGVRVKDAIHLTTVFRRWPKGLPTFAFMYDPQETPNRVVTLKVGQVARERIQGINLDCAIVRSGTRNVPTVYCATDDKVGPVPGRYATLASDEDAAVGKVGATRRTTIVWVHPQP